MEEGTGRVTERVGVGVGVEGKRCEATVTHRVASQRRQTADTPQGGKPAELIIGPEFPGVSAFEIDTGVGCTIG